MARKRRESSSRRAVVPTPAGIEREVLDLLAELGVDTRAARPELSDPDRRRTDAVADSALQRILLSPRTDRERSPRGRSAQLSARINAWRRSRLLLVAASVGLVAGAVVIAHPGGSSQRHDSDPPAIAAVTPPMSDFSLVSHDLELEGRPAASELRELAARAASSDADTSAPVHHVRLDGWYFTEGPGTRALVPTVTDRYFLPNGEVHQIESRGTPLDRFGRIRTQPAHGKELANETFPGPATGAGYADQLPTDPHQLRARLVPDRAECPILAECLAQQIVDLNYTWVPRPELKSALWLSLVGEDAVRYLGLTKDRLGREAVAFSVPTSDAVRRIVIYADRETGSMLGSEEVIIRRTAEDGLPADVPAPAVVTFTAIAASERIDGSGVPE